MATPSGGYTSPSRRGDDRHFPWAPNILGDLENPVLRDAGDRADDGAPLPLFTSSFEEANAAIILPTLNEERGLARTLPDIPFARLRLAGWRVRPLVIDGGSTDRTLAVANAWGLPILRQVSRGKGGAIREALDWLGERNVQYAVVLDADATYPGASILPALELLDAGTHLVVGVRQSAAGPPKGARDLVHRIGNALLNFAAGQFSRATILDVCSGFWGVQVQRARELALLSNDFGIEAELFLKAHRADWTVRQIPIPYRERVGEAKLHALSDGIRILLAIVRFGHRSLQSAPPAASVLPAFVRDLLLTALVGGGELVLVCPPSRENEARALAFFLERSNVRPRVVLRPGPVNPVAPDGNGSTSRPSARDPYARSEPLSTPPIPDGQFIGPVIRFGAGRRMLYVELPDIRPFGVGEVSAGPPTPPVSRSGAYLSQARTPGDLFDPIRLLASRLSQDSMGRQTTFLEANGLAVQGAYDESSFNPEPLPEPTAAPASPREGRYTDPS
ncbi:MAG: glycosyltransferase family 2 protein [Thermoplasmata archaeon]|nr:glycosyltransferase family 2 protein [Thermoplasmata archaeon]